MGVPSLVWFAYPVRNFLECCFCGLICPPLAYCSGLTMQRCGLAKEFNPPSRCFLVVLNPFRRFCRRGECMDRRYRIVDPVLLQRTSFVAIIPSSILVPEFVNGALNLTSH